MCEVEEEGNGGEFLEREREGEAVLDLFSVGPFISLIIYLQMVGPELDDVPVNFFYFFLSGETLNQCPAKTSKLVCLFFFFLIRS